MLLGQGQNENGRFVVAVGFSPGGFGLVRFRVRRTLAWVLFGMIIVPLVQVSASYAVKVRGLIAMPVQ